MSSVLEFSSPPAGFDLCIFPPNFFFDSSLSDFVAGVPKQLNLYGAVRKFTFISKLLKWESRALDLGLIQENKRQAAAFMILSQREFFLYWIPIPETVLIFDHVKRPSPYVAALLQVYILNGTNLKNLINYTGEQVSQRVVPSCSTSCCFLCLSLDENSLPVGQCKERKKSFCYRT